MSFLWPWGLALLALAPLLIWLYFRSLRSAARAVTMHPDLALIARASETGRRWRRHVPAFIYLGTCTLALFALARPSLPAPEAHPQAAIILALDSSWSMRATDIEPSRLEAAKEAVYSFLDDVPDNIRVGLVTFGYFANTVAPPTRDHDLLREAIEELTLQRGTAIGEALLASVAALPSLEERRAAADDPKDLATVILLSDGQNRGGIDPVTALEMIVPEQVTVHTVGVGTDRGGGGDWGPGGYSRGYRFDESTLRRIAADTGGRYVFVDNASDLNDVYRELGNSLVWRMAPEEATGIFSLAAALLLLLGIVVAESQRRVY
ncbi:MAG TPA: VWA domain-containing protein [Trueperaceae bacterium]